MFRITNVDTEEKEEEFKVGDWVYVPRITDNIGQIIEIAEEWGSGSFGKEYAVSFDYGDQFSRMCTCGKEDLRPAGFSLERRLHDKLDKNNVRYAKTKE
jgi:hypothetical protein